MLPMTIGQRIKSEREKRNWSQSDLAKRAGVSQPVIADLETGSQKTTRKLPGIASALGLSAADLDEAYDFPLRQNMHHRPTPDIGEHDLPVYSAVEAGNGQMVVSTDPIEVVPRPWYLKNVRDGYALLVLGESMEPRYAPGEIVVVNPKAALIRGKDCVVTTATEGGDFRAMLKTYAGATEDAWKLRQFNPEKNLLLNKREWPFCLRVVGRYDGG